MNESTMDGPTESSRPRTGALMGLAVLSLPFWAGAALLGLRMLGLPDSVSILGKAYICQSTIFALGMGLGISGSGVALWTASDRTRLLGLSATLLGTAFVVLSLMMGWFVGRAAASVAVSPLPFALPSLLVFVALLLAAAAIRGPAVDDDPDDAELSEEQQSPLSQP